MRAAEGGPFAEEREMNARTYRSVSEWWEWILAGSLALASCAALVLLLLTVARMQAREAWQAKRLSADTTGTCVDGIGTRESGKSKWLATGPRFLPAGIARRGAHREVWRTTTSGATCPMKRRWSRRV